MIIKLTESEYDLLSQQQRGIISSEELGETFGRKLLLNELQVIISNLGNELDGKQKLSLLSYLIDYSLNFRERTILLNDLLLQTWHNEHENIVHDLQRYYHEDTKTINTLLHLIHNPPNRNAEVGFFEVFVRKVIYALGAHPEPYNFEALAELAKSDNLIIKDLAIHQIDKRKILGRWEAGKIKDWEK